MATNPTASRLRQRIASLRARRDRLEHRILQRRRMIDACLVERYALAGGRRRGSPAYYLSRKIDGRTKLTYVRQDQLRRARAATEAWRLFSSTLAEWAKVNTEIERLMRALGREQIVELPGRADDGG